MSVYFKRYAERKRNSRFNRSFFESLQSSNSEICLRWSECLYWMRCHCDVFSLCQNNDRFCSAELNEKVSSSRHAIYEISRTYDLSSVWARRDRYQQDELLWIPSSLCKLKLTIIKGSCNCAATIVNDSDQITTYGGSLLYSSNHAFTVLQFMFLSSTQHEQNQRSVSLRSLARRSRADLY